MTNHKTQINHKLEITNIQKLNVVNFEESNDRFF